MFTTIRGSITAWGDTASKWQSLDSSPGLPDPTPVFLLCLWLSHCKIHFFAFLFCFVPLRIKGKCLYSSALQRTKGQEQDRGGEKVGQLGTTAEKVGLLIIPKELKWSSKNKIPRQNDVFSRRNCKGGGKRGEQRSEHKHWGWSAGEGEQIVFHQDLPSLS